MSKGSSDRTSDMKAYRECPLWDKPKAKMNNNNEKPREPKTVKQELRELELSMLSSKEWLLVNPKDNLIKNLIEQDEYKLKREKKALELQYKTLKKEGAGYKAVMACLDKQRETLKLLGKVQSAGWKRIQAQDGSEYSIIISEDCKV